MRVCTGVCVCVSFCVSLWLRARAWVEGYLLELGTTDRITEEYDTPPPVLLPIASVGGIDLISPFPSHDGMLLALSRADCHVFCEFMGATAMSRPEHNPLSTFQLSCSPWPQCSLSIGGTVCTSRCTQRSPTSYKLYTKSHLPRKYCLSPRPSAAFSVGTNINIERIVWHRVPRICCPSWSIAV